MTGRKDAMEVAGSPPGADGGAVGDRKLTLSLPAAVVRELRRRTALEETTLRALVLAALAAAGYAVPAAEIRDRRRRAAPFGTSFTEGRRP
jgi:hypothetical protein